MEAMLEEYPEYHGFVSNALRTSTNDPAAYRGVSSRAWKWTENARKRIKVLVLHSPEDELLSIAQPCAVLERFAQLRGPDEVAQAIQIPVPEDNSAASAYSYRGNRAEPSVAEMLHGTLHGVPSAIQLDWVHLTVRIQHPGNAN